MSGSSLGQTIDALAATIDARAAGDPAQSYTAKLLSQGVLKCAKKLGEEGVEAALAAVAQDKAALASEAADVLYHLLVTLKAAGVAPSDVAVALERREGKSGLEEKAGR